MTPATLMTNPAARATAILGLVVLAFATLPAQASSASTDLSAICKVGVHQEFASKHEVFRFKYKGDSGARSAKRVRLEVIPPSAERFIAECEIDARNYRLLEVSRDS